MPEEIWSSNHIISEGMAALASSCQGALRDRQYERLSRQDSIIFSRCFAKDITGLELLPMDGNILVLAPSTHRDVFQRGS
jgi:hypothetical protein